MSINNETNGSSGYQSRDQQAAMGVQLCGGECLHRANQAFQEASQIARELGCTLTDMEKRFKYLLDMARNQHEQAEIILEHTLAIYETAFGQEHATVAHMLSTLASLQASHGKAEYSNYLQAWGSDMLSASREEPRHDFFNLVGYSRPTAEEEPPCDQPIEL